MMFISFAPLFSVPGCRGAERGAGRANYHRTSRSKGLIAPNALGSGGPLKVDQE